MYRGPIIDVHTHLALDDAMVVLAEPHRVEDYRTRIDSLDVRAAGALAMAPAGDLDRTRTQNDLVLQLADADELFYARSPSCGCTEGTCQKIGLDRVVFGSDYPLDDPVAAIEAVSSLGFDEAGLTAVMHDNACSLFGI
jgi:hypothetical protein